MQSLLVKERELTIKRDQLEQKRQQLDEQISRLNQPDGSEDPRLNMLAERFGGVLLSELYDDVPIDDAPYFSALYGPARHAIVVRDLEAVKTQLAQLDDCPDDLYLIEGDPSAFDDNVLSAQELELGVVVQVSIVNYAILSSQKFHYLGEPHGKNALSNYTLSVMKSQSNTQNVLLMCKNASVYTNISASLWAYILL